MNAVIENIYSSVCYSKMYSFLLRKSKVLRILHWKKREIVSIAATRSKK